MGVISATLRGRRLAERLMRDQCVIRRPTGELATNPDFTVTPVYEQVYAGQCRLQTYEAHETTVIAGEATHVVQRSTVQLPVSDYQPEPGDIVTITAALDPLLVGRSVRIVQQYPVKSHASAYRVFVDTNVGEDVPPLT